jgi:hypothetical protein
MSESRMDWDSLSAFDEWRDWYEDRLEERYRQLGSRSPRCAVEGCVERHPFCLTGAGSSVLCYEHALDRWTEDQHWLGQHNDPLTSPIPANDHRFISELQSLWPQETLRNPDGSPLLKSAAALRAWLDVMRLLIERVVGRIPPFLEQLDTWLRERLGARWWDEFDWSAD